MAAITLQVIIWILLALIALTAVSGALLWRRLRALRERLKSMGGLVSRIAGVPAAPTARIPPRGQLEELEESLKLLEAQLNTIATDLSDERERVILALNAAGVISAI